jgi:hypothetical protein
MTQAHASWIADKPTQTLDACAKKARSSAFGKLGEAKPCNYSLFQHERGIQKDTLRPEKNGQ